MHGVEHKILDGNLRERDGLEDLSIDGIIVLNIAIK
jgi:hypothetical protein